MIKMQLLINLSDFFIEEIIREKILKHYKKEIPYSVEIEVEEFFEEEEIIRIRAIIYCFKEKVKKGF